MLPPMLLPPRAILLVSMLCTLAPGPVIQSQAAAVSSIATPHLFSGDRP
jgi:hypothetical protein